MQTSDGMRYQTGVVVEKGKEKDLSLLAGMGRIGEFGAVHGVALPQIAETSPLEAAIGVGPLVDEEMSGCGASQGELATQGPRRNRLLGDGLSRVHIQGFDDGARGTTGLLALEGFGPVEGLG